MAHTKAQAAIMNNPGGQRGRITSGSEWDQEEQNAGQIGGQMTKAEMLAMVKEQALSKQKKKEVPVRTVQEQIKFYATFSFSLIAITGFSALMFLVPFIVDPALATLTADFVEKPVECRVILSRAILGLSNCSWSSCREGCTRDIFSCHHILVEYTYLQEDYKQMNRERELEGLDPSPTKHNAVLFVNVKGCGYPPSVNCSRWITQFGVPESTFPCYYARTNQSVAITHLDTKRDLRDLLLSTFIPLIACLVSGVALCLLHTKCVTSCRSPAMYDVVDGEADKTHSREPGWKPLTLTNALPSNDTEKNRPRSILHKKTDGNENTTRSKLRKRLSFQSAAGSIKRKADLFELPTITKKVKTGGEIDSTSSTENLLQDLGEADHTYMNPAV